MQWARTALEPDIAWKFHHVIPWETLREFWQATRVRGYFPELSSFCRILGMTASWSLVERMPNGGLTLVEREELFENLSWPAWNVVEGPADRDDENDAELDLFHHGLTPDEVQRMQDLQALHGAMTAFLVAHRNPAQHAALEMRRVGAHLALLRMFRYRDEGFIAYREALWTTTVTGRISTKPAGRKPYWLRTPRFKKADGAPAAPVDYVEVTGKLKCGKCSNIFTPDGRKPERLAGHQICTRCNSQVYVEKSKFKDPRT